VSAPLDFLKIFAGQLRQAGISFAITSGMAFVHYGLQQTTEDSDWIIPAEDLARLRELFARLESSLPPWRISYRQICGAPLETEFMEHAASRRGCGAKRWAATRRAGPRGMWSRR